MRLVQFNLYGEGRDSKIFINTDKIIAVKEHQEGYYPTDIEMEDGIAYTVQHSVEWVIKKLRSPHYG